PGRGHRFARGYHVSSLLAGTCLDPRLWQGPESFVPRRFRGFSWDDDPNTLIAQRAGRHSENHRCPGEWSTVELLKQAVRLLASPNLSVPGQDLSIPLNRFPKIGRAHV